MSGYVFHFPTGFGTVGNLERDTRPGLDLGSGGGLAVHRPLSEQVIQSIGMILATTPGERVLRPRYGSRLQELVFMPNDAATAGMAIQFVKSALARWEPRIRVEHVDAAPDPELASRLVVTLEFRIRGELTARELEFGLDLSAGGTP